MEYTIHRYAEFLPLPEEGSVEEIMLHDSLKDHSMLTPITLFQGMILDGRRRYFAHKKYPEIELKTVDFPGTEEEALEFVAASINRRELTVGQRALFAWQYTREHKTLTVKEAKEHAQEKFGTNKGAIELVGAIINSNNHDKADKDILVTAIGKGYPVNTAYNVMKKLPVSVWKEIVLDGDGGDAQKKIKAANKTASDAKKETKETIKRNAAINIVNIAAVNGGQAKYQLILLDLPGTILLENIGTIPAAETCVMLFWSDLYQLAQKIQYMEEHGFTYQHAYVYYNNSTKDTKLLLCGLMGDAMPTIKEPMELHHTKQITKDSITKTFPNLTKFDMFGKGKDHEGMWIHGGNSVKERPARNGKGGKGKTSATTEEQPTA